MQKTIVFFALTAAFFFSCSNDDIEQSHQIDESQYTTFVAMNQAATRADYILWHSVGSNAQPCWQQDDKLWLYMNPTWRVPSVGNNIPSGQVWDRANFYFPQGYGADSYKVNYLGSSADGIHVSFPAQQWNLLPHSTAHLRLTGDCAEATATRVPGKLGVYTMAFNRLPAYLCILPYISDEYSYLTSVMKRVVIKSDKVISGTFDVGQFGLDPAHATNTGTTLDCYFAGTASAWVYTDVNIYHNAMYIAIPPGHHNLTIEVYCHSDRRGDFNASRTIGWRWYGANTLTDIKFDVAENIGASHNNINAGATIATAKKTRGVEAVVDTTWNGTFDQ